MRRVALNFREYGKPDESDQAATPVHEESLTAYMINRIAPVTISWHKTNSDLWGSSTESNTRKKETCLSPCPRHQPKAGKTYT
jgi:hypothetical protein